MRHIEYLPIGFAASACLAALIAGQWVAADPQPGRYVPGQLIVKFEDDTSPSERAAIKNDLKASTLRRFSRLKAELVSVEGITVDQAIKRYKSHGKVEYIEPNYIVRALDIPDDPMLDQLWALRNSGQTGGTPDADIDADDAWNVGTGSRTVVVGVLDTGVDYTHPDLAANMWVNPGEIPDNGLDDDDNGFVDDFRGWDFYNGNNDPMDDNGHGTHCAGTIGAVGNNGVGVVGVNWEVSICPIKFIGADGYGTDADAIASIEYATVVGVDIMNNSWGGEGHSQAMREAIQDAYDAGILFVAGAGNIASDNDEYAHYPSSYDLGNVIAVAATDHNDDLASFSNYGAISVDLGAPGVRIVSTLPGSHYGSLSGTSMATPHVSGVAALIWSLYPGMTVDLLKARLLDMTDPLPSLAGRCVTGGRLNAFRPIAEPDTIAPAAITDLGTSSAGSSTMHLSWTATGDDGGSGTASFYQVRYSTSPITEGNFYDETRAGNEPDPQPSGSFDEMEVTGLDFNTTYYFAVKAYDEFGNESAVSNVATGTTLGPPDIALSPTLLSESLAAGEASQHSLMISNEGDGVLDFTIPGIQFVFGASTPGEYLELDKGDPDPRAGDPVTEGSGGPDGFGYQWIDSDEPGGPVFDWVDITSIGTPIPLGGDDVSEGPFDIGFPFPFYDSRFESFYICTNGFISFTSGSMPYWNQPLPNAEAPENLVAPFWDDLVFSGNQAYMYNDGSRLIVEYENVTHYDVGGPYTFEVILYPSGKIVFQYLSMGSPTNGATVGIQNATRDEGLQVAFNTDYVHDGLAVQIGVLPQWLSVAPTSGSVYADGYTDLEVSFDASGLVAGDYDANVVIESNDPDEGTFLVPATLHVTGVPDIGIAGEVSLASAQLFTTANRGSTYHALATSTPAVGSGLLAVEVVGQYSSPLEYAIVTVEDTMLGLIAGPGYARCSSLRSSYALSFEQLQGFLADGVVEVTVDNNWRVRPYCSDNRHTVTLSYPAPGDVLDFGPLFVGLTDTLRLLVQNLGTDVLNVKSISTNDRGFSASHASLSLDPKAFQWIAVVFEPLAPGTHTGTLSIKSNDPDERFLTVSLRGEGVAPPVIAVSPGSLGEEIVAGQTAGRFFTVLNEGGSDLTCELTVKRGIDEESGDVERVDSPWLWALEDAISSSPAPVGYEAAPTPATLDVLSGTESPDVLIIQDSQPWDSAANEVLLEANDLSYGFINSSQLGDTDIDLYRIVLLPSDQPTSFYENITAQRSKLETYVSQGGVLEVHACGWGWNDGDVSLLILPGGMTVPDYPDPNMGVPRPYVCNYVVLPGHPLANGLHERVCGPLLSHAHFGSVPGGAEVVTVNGVRGATLVTYQFGDGMVLASTQALEWGFDRHEEVRPILMNMVAYAKSVSEVDWLRLEPRGGSVTAGNSLVVSATLDAAGLNAGVYKARVVAYSNDPSIPELAVPVDLTVIGAPDIEVAGEIVSVASTQVHTGGRASTHHSLSAPLHAGAPGSLAVEVMGGFTSSYDRATVAVEGTTLGTVVGPAGQHCGSVRRSFALSFEQLQSFLADGVVHVTIKNSRYVDASCPENTHTVVLSYPGLGDGLDFGPVSVSATDTLRLLLWNVGTDVLNVTSISTDEPEFSVSHASLSITPRASQWIAVAFTPPGPGPLRGALSIESNDPAEPLITIPLLGWTPGPAVIAVSPDSMTEVLAKDRTTDRPLTVLNEGGSDLTFELSVHRTIDEQLGDVGSIRSPGVTSSADAASSWEAPVGYQRDATVSTFEASSGSKLVSDHRESPSQTLSNRVPCAKSVGEVRWLTLEPTSGTLTPGDSLLVTAAFDATGLGAGTYETRVVAHSIDPLVPELTVPVSLTVILVPDIAVTPISLDFDLVYLGFSGTLQLAVENEGSSRLSIADIASSNADFTPSVTGFDLDPRAVRNVTVTFSPSSEGMISGALTIYSDDPDEPEVEVEVSGMALIPPDIEVVPDSVVVAVRPDVPGAETLTIHNAGGSDLTFDAGAHVAYTPVPLGGCDGDKEGPQSTGDPTMQSQGGPDAFGYRWSDSDEPGGPVFDWVDITGVGVRIPMSGTNENTGPYPIGFDFPFYGSMFDSFRICTNGFISFTSHAILHWNRELPSRYGAENMIAPWWDNLSFGGVNRAYYYNDGTRLIIEYVEVTRILGGPYTFEIILYPDGTIVFQYLSMVPKLNSATIGIQNATKDDGLQIAYNEEYVHDNLAVRISNPSWVFVSPKEGVVPAGNSLTLSATVHPSGMAEGVYDGTIVIASNDPYKPLISVPVNVVVRVVEATYVDLVPNTLNLSSRGKWITGHIELPAEFHPADVVVSSVLLEHVVPADPDHWGIGDVNENGVEDLMVRFSRSNVEAVLPEGDSVPVTIVGEIEDKAWFTGADTIRTIRPHLASMGSELVLRPQQRQLISWTPPEGFSVDYYRLLFSSDRGEAWSAIADNIDGTSYVWTVPDVRSEQCLLRLFAFDKNGSMGYDTSDEFFTIAARPPDKAGTGIPQRFVLFQNWPNPAVGGTAIAFDLPKAGHVSLKIFDVSGALVRTLADEPMCPGHHRLLWDGRSEQGQKVSSGVYFYRIEAGDFRTTRKVVLLK